MAPMLPEGLGAGSRGSTDAAGSPRFRQHPGTIRSINMHVLCVQVLSGKAGGGSTG